MINFEKLREKVRVRPGYYHVYLQVPFCRSRCPFCCYASQFNASEMTDLSLIPDYVDALVSEIECYEFPGEPLQSINMGGGTPTLLDAAHVKRIINAVLEAAQRKLTGSFVSSFETSPQLASLDKLEGFYEAGMRRVSIGVQSYFVEDLKFLARGNTPEQSYQAFTNARSAGYEQINIDLLFGFPGSTFERWRANLAIAFEQAPEFMCINLMNYGYPGGNHFKSVLADKGYPVPPFDERVAMFEYTLQELKRHGYESLGSLMFSRVGLQYDYETHGRSGVGNIIGFGPSVTSILPDRVIVGFPSTKKYIQRPSFPKASLPYRYYTCGLIGAHLTCLGQVSKSALEPILESDLYAAIESDENARHLFAELKRKNLIEFYDDGFRFKEDMIPRGCLFVWEYSSS